MMLKTIATSLQPKPIMPLRELVAYAFGYAILIFVALTPITYLFGISGKHLVFTSSNYWILPAGLSATTLIASGFRWFLYDSREQRYLTKQYYRDADYLEIAEESGRTMFVRPLTTTSNEADDLAVVIFKADTLMTHEPIIIRRRDYELAHVAYGHFGNHNSIK